MQITQEVFPEMVPAMEVMRHTTLMEELTNKQKAREEAMRPTVENLKKFVDFYTEKISKVIANVCNKHPKLSNATIELNDNEITKGVWKRQIGINTFDSKTSKPVMFMTVDCRSSKIQINLSVDPACQKCFKARITAAIKSFTKGKKRRGR